MNSKSAWSGVFFAVMLLASQPVVAQSVQTSSVIGLITHQANNIDKSLDDTAATMKTFTRGQESGVLSLYTAADTSQKLVVQLVSNRSGDVTEYYFLRGRLIYVVQVCKNFGSGVRNGSLSSCSTISENRFYLTNGDLAAWLRGAGAGPIELRAVSADKESRAAKLQQITRSASLWMAFARSPATDFKRFERQLGR